MPPAFSQSSHLISPLSSSLSLGLANQSTLPVWNEDEFEYSKPSVREFYANDHGFLYDQENDVDYLSLEDPWHQKMTKKKVLDRLSHQDTRTESKPKDKSYKKKQRRTEAVLIAQEAWNYGAAAGVEGLGMFKIRQIEHTGSTEMFPEGHPLYTGEYHGSLDGTETMGEQLSHADNTFMASAGKLILGALGDDPDELLSDAEAMAELAAHGEGLFMAGNLMKTAGHFAFSWLYQGREGIIGSIREKAAIAYDDVGQQKLNWRLESAQGLGAMDNLGLQASLYFYHWPKVTFQAGVLSLWNGAKNLFVKDPEALTVKDRVKEKLDFKKRWQEKQTDLSGLYKGEVEEFLLQPLREQLAFTTKDKISAKVSGLRLAALAYVSEPDGEVKYRQSQSAKSFWSGTEKMAKFASGAVVLGMFEYMRNNPNPDPAVVTTGLAAGIAGMTLSHVATIMATNSVNRGFPAKMLRIIHKPKESNQTKKLLTTYGFSNGKRLMSVFTLGTIAYLGAMMVYQGGGGESLVDPVALEALQNMPAEALDGVSNSYTLYRELQQAKSSMPWYFEWPARLMMITPHAVGVAMEASRATTAVKDMVAEASKMVTDKSKTMMESASQFWSESVYAGNGDFTTFDRIVAHGGLGVPAALTSALAMYYMPDFTAQPLAWGLMISANVLTIGQTVHKYKGRIRKAVSAWWTKKKNRDAANDNSITAKEDVA